MRIKGIILSSLIIALLGIFFLSEIYLRGLVENKIAVEIKEKFQGEVIVKKVKIQSWPALKLLTGKVEKLSVTLENAAFGNLVLSKIELEIVGVQVAYSKSGLETSALLENAQKTEGRVSIKERELNSFLLQEGRLPLKEHKLTLEEDKVKVTGKTILLNSQVQLAITGNLGVKGQEIFFSPQEVEVEGFTLPKALQTAVFKKLNFNFKLENLPFELEFKSIEVLPGQLEVIVGQ